MRLILTNYDYVNINKDVCFLGKWIKKSNDSIVAYHFDNQDFLLNSTDYLCDLYLNYLKDISRFLNEIHRVDKSERYWETLLGTWLMNYLAVYYDRFTTIDNLRKYQTFSFSIAFKKQELPLIYDYYQFSVLSSTDDQFNYNLFVDIMDFLNIEYSVDSNISQNSKSNDAILTHMSHMGYSIKNKVLTFINKISLLYPFAKTYVSSTGLSTKNLFKLILKSKFKIMPLFFFKIKQKEIKERDNIRNKLELFLKNSENEFERYINLRLIKDIPVAYIENYQNNIIEMKKAYINKNLSSSVIFSKFQDSSELFKFFIANFIDHSNNKYYGYQHGGYYGMLRFKQQEFNEIRLSDKYFFWGQKNLFFNTNIKVGQMPALKFANLKKINKNKKNITKIVYIGANFNYYLYELETYYLGPQWREYYLLQEQFFNNLSLKLRKILLNRVYGFYASKKKEELVKKISWIKFDNEKKIESHFNNETLLIIDYPGTTFLEALYVNIPTIMFWDNDKFLMRDGVENDLDTLRSCNILFNNPLEATNYINNTTLNSIKKNWYSEKTQNVITSFLKKYAYCSDNWANILIKSLNES